MPGFHTEGGVWNFSPPQNIEFEYGYYSYLHVTEHKHVLQNVVWKVCPRLCQKQSERMYIQNYPSGACPQFPLVGTHAFCTLLSSCYHPFPTHLKILYETLSAKQARLNFFQVIIMLT